MIYDTLPYASSTSLNPDASMVDRCHFRHTEADGQPSEKVKAKWRKRSVALLKENIQLGCVSQDSNQKKSILREVGRWGSTHAVKFSKTMMRPRKNSGKIGSIEGSQTEMCTSGANSVGSKIRGQNARRNPETGSDAPAEDAWDLAKDVHKLKTERKGTFYSLAEARGDAEPSSEREFVIDSEASMHMLSKKDLSSCEQETLRRSWNHHNGGVTANRRSVHDLHLFVTVQLLGDTPAVLSLGKICQEHSYTCEWTSGQKPHLTKDGKNILCKTDNYVP